MALQDIDLWRPDMETGLKVDMMCEFTSLAVTPTPVGGSAMGMVYLAHEGIDFGRAATLTLTTFFLTNCFSQSHALS